MARTQTERKNDWNAKTYERITLMVKAGERDKLRAAADAAGISANRFILESINAQHPGLLSLLDDKSREKKQTEPEE